MWGRQVRGREGDATAGERRRQVGHAYQPNGVSAGRERPWVYWAARPGAGKGGGNGARPGKWAAREGERSAGRTGWAAGLGLVWVLVGFGVLVSFLFLTQLKSKELKLI